MKSKKELLEIEKNTSIIGWDFSYLEPFVTQEVLPWDYKQVVLTYINEKGKLLDMETGGGEFLLTLEHPHHLTFATEGYVPNYKLCLERLAPLGISVENVLGEDKLPYQDNMFDVIINRHGAYDVEEITRILKPGGLFITQQVGSYNNQPLSDVVTPHRDDDLEGFTLKTEIEKFKLHNYDIIRSDEKKLYCDYHDMRGIIFMCTIIEWEFPGFSVESCYDKLRQVNKQIDQNGFFRSLEHRFMFVAKNNK